MYTHGLSRYDRGRRTRAETPLALGGVIWHWERQKLSETISNLVWSTVVLCSEVGICICMFLYESSFALNPCVILSSGAYLKILGVARSINKAYIFALSSPLKVGQLVEGYSREILSKQVNKCTRCILITKRFYWDVLPQVHDSLRLFHLRIMRN